MISEFKDKVILVTGGAGSIGSILVQEILKFEPKAVRVFDNHEFSLHKMETSLLEDERKITRFFVGDVRDRDRLEMAMNSVDIVYHTAAYKHVHLCDYNPLEAIKTNVLGTQNTIDAALRNKVKKFVFISTDKAVNPVGTLGASKLLGEKITTAANYYKGENSTIFASVRFGNVTMSNGSVIPTFIKQMKTGGPLTVTSPQMTRFLMPMKEAIRLIFKATKEMQGGEVFVLKMKSVKMGDLTEALAQEFKLITGAKNKTKIQKIGRRTGEKTHEELIAEEESHRSVDLEDMIMVMPSGDPPYHASRNPMLDKIKKVNSKIFSSEHKPMTLKQIINFIRENKIFESA